MITDLDTLHAPGSTFNQVKGNQYHIYNLNNPQLEDEDPSSSEPQNALTTLFNEQEWKALKELRKNLPRIFSDAYHHRPLHERVTPINLWGVTIDPCGPPDARVSVLLMKFLRVHNLDVHKTQNGLTKFLRWRDEYGIDKVVQEHFSDDVLLNQAHVCGKSKAGQPVAYLRYTGDLLRDAQGFIRSQYALFESAIALLDFESVDSVLLITDMRDVSFLDIIGVIRPDIYSELLSHSDGINLYRRHFVSCEYVVNESNWMAWGNNTIFGVYQRMLSLSTRICLGNNPDKINRVLSAVIDNDQLPKSYGGNGAD